MSWLGIVLALLFVPFGGFIGDIEGIVVAVFLGYLTGAVIQLTLKVNKLGTQLSALEKMYKGMRQAVTEPQVEKTVPVTEQARPIPPVQPPIPAPAPPAIKPAPVRQPQANMRPSRPVAQPSAIETAIDKLFAKIYTFFTDGNVVAKVGILILFVGVGALIKYAYDHEMLPIELRIAFFGILGIVMVFFGWRLRDNKRIYALLLQGGGIGVMYLTVFGAAKLYGMLPVGFAFAVMVALVLLSATLAVLQDAKYLALYGAAGGFLAPVLASTGTGSHVMLFSYYALLNLGIVGIAWYRSWRELNLLGFIFTFVIGSMWGAKYYKPEFFASVEPFLILYFIYFAIISVLFAYRQPPNLKGYVDSTLVFGVPIISFTLQAALVMDFEYGLAFSALGMSAFYIVLATALWHRGPQGMRLITEAFLAMGVVFGSLAIPLALDGRWTSAAWALEGAAIIWIGVRQSRMLARLFGLLLQGGAGYFFLLDFTTPAGLMPVLNGIYLGGLTIALAGLFSSYYLFSHRETLRDFEKSLHIPLLVWGLAWWLGSGLHEINRTVIGHARELNISMIFISLSILLLHWLQTRLSWHTLRFVVLGHVYAILLYAMLSFFLGSGHPLAQFGYLTWPLAYMIQYLMLYRYRDTTGAQVLKWQHMLSFWVLLVLCSWEAAWQVDYLVKGAAAWRDVMYALTPALLMLSLFTVAKQIRWPVAKHYAWYAGTGAIPVMVVLLFVALGFGIFHEGNPWPIQYIPVLNPVDLVVAFLIYLLILWYLQLQKINHALVTQLDSRFMRYGIAAVAFMWLNGIVARTIHHWFHVRHDIDAMLRSVEFQASISVIWTLLALTVMVIASRRSLRNLWFVGLGLFIIVAAKLFLFDISTSDAMMMSISIIVVGILAVVFGYYLSPLPPRSATPVIKESHS